MSRKRMVFPMLVKQGSVAVRIYRVQNKGRDSFTVSYFADGRRKPRIFAGFDEALAEARSKAIALSRGELDALELRAVDARAYVNALDLLKPTGMALELVAKDYLEAWKVTEMKSSEKQPEAAMKRLLRAQTRLQAKQFLVHRSHWYLYCCWGCGDIIERFLAHSM